MLSGAKWEWFWCDPCNLFLSDCLRFKITIHCNLKRNALNLGFANPLGLGWESVIFGWVVLWQTLSIGKKRGCSKCFCLVVSRSLGHVVIDKIHPAKHHSIASGPSFCLFAQGELGAVEACLNLILPTMNDEVEILSRYIYNIYNISQGRKRHVMKSQRTKKANRKQTQIAVSLQLLDLGTIHGRTHLAEPFTTWISQAISHQVEMQQPALPRP